MLIDILIESTSVLKVGFFALLHLSPEDRTGRRMLSALSPYSDWLRYRTHQTSGGNGLSPW